MPTSTSRGRYNWACPAALKIGRPVLLVVVAVFCEDDATLGAFTVDCVTGAGATVGVVGTGTGAVVGVVGTGTGLAVGVVGKGAGGGSVGVGVGPGPLIVVGPPTGPVQIFPTSQHPMMPLLARAQ